MDRRARAVEARVRARMHHVRRVELCCEAAFVGVANFSRRREGEDDEEESEDEEDEDNDKGNDEDDKECKAENEAADLRQGGRGLFWHFVYHGVLYQEVHNLSSR